MPKPTKLHSKGKAKPTSLQKPCSLKDSSSTQESEHEHAVRQFELELCWCIQQLERTLQNKKNTEKQIQDAWKVLQVLKNNNQPIIRKRQLMRSHFGDYRAKMLAEEKKLAKMASKMKITEKADHPKATFIRKSAFLTTGDNSFRFNFNIAPEQIDNATGNLETGTGNVADTIGNTDEATVDNGDVLAKDQPAAEDNASNFKFTFSNSQFRFNFNVDDS